MYNLEECHSTLPIETRIAVRSKEDAKKKREANYHLLTVAVVLTDRNNIS